MKKLLAILLSAVLLLTTVVSTAAFTATAESEGEVLADTVVMPKYVDSLGDELYLYHTANPVPSSIASGGSALRFTGAKNSTNLPFTSLISISGGSAATSIANINTKPVLAGDYAGFMFYVEVPEIEEDYSYTYVVKSKDDEGNDINTYETKTSNKFHLAFYVLAYDASAEKNTTFYNYAGFKAYTMKVGTTEWKSMSTIGYGMDLDSGFKGYVYVPFKAHNFAADDEFCGFSVRELTANNNYTQNSTANYPLWGYIPEGDSLTVSGSMLVKGEFGSVTAPDATFAVIEGEKYYYNTGKVEDISDFNFPTLTTGVIKTDMSTTTNVTTKFELDSSYGVRSDYSGLSALTDEMGTSTKNRVQYDLNDYDNSVRLTAAYTFPETIRLNQGGFIFYAELPSVEGDHEICFKRTYANGTINMTQATGVTWYRLQDGSDEWVEGVTGTNAYALDFGDYDAEKGCSPAWSGYIYFPYNFFRNLNVNVELVEFGIGIRVYRTTISSDAYAGTPLTEAIRFSAVTHVTEFDPDTTLAYGDGGRLVDLATGEYIYSKDYSVADSPIGNSDLIKAGNPNNVLSMEYISAAKMNATVMELGNSAMYTDINAEGKPNGKLVPSGAVIKHPAIKVSKSVDEGHTGRLFYLNTPTIHTADGDGLIFYIKNDDDIVLNLRLYAYGTAYKTNAETGESEKVFENIMHFYSEEYKLLGSDGKWQSLTGNGYKMPIPANFEGYLYLDFSTMPSIGGYADNEGTNLYNGMAVMVYDQTALVDGTFTFSYPMLVTNFTNKNAGIAFVNRAAVSQNLFTGEFALQNDPESDLNVGLLELVRAKGTAGFADFRNDYLKYYMNDERIIEPCLRHEGYYNKKCTRCGADIDITGSLGNVMIMGDSISTYGGYSYGRDADYKPALNQHWYAGEQDNTDLTSVKQTWWDMLISNTDSTLAYNRSASGSTIAEAKWYDGVPEKKYNSFNARLDEVLANDELQFFGYTPEDIDTFIFFGGTNDNGNCNIGEPKYSDWTADDLKYFAPAYCRYIATVKANFPNAEIVSLVDTTLTNVAATQIAINEYYGITTVTINGFDEVAPHPTVKGMKQIEKTLRYALCEE